MVLSEEGMKHDRQQTRASDLQVGIAHYCLKGSGQVNAGSGHDSTAKGLAMDLPVSGSGLLAAVFPFSPQPSVSEYCIHTYLVRTYCCSYKYYYTK